MHKIKGSSEMEVPPLRSLDEFLLDSARFQLPNWRDLEKWNNRVVNNMLYYQTNYFVTAVIIFAFVGFLQPVKMLIGTIAVGLIILAFAYVSKEGRAIHNLKKKYPALGVISMLGGAGFLMYTFGSLLVFLFGVLMPISVIFVHASLRLRNIKNKLANKVEGIGLKRTPMGELMEQLDLFFGKLAVQTENLLKKQE
ncbi:hypothetical protein TKK_0015845 [Trichogramma kaykai]|uniref:PRA1 family protein n=1 Tax=Trichogramma kaykai TaxID=54128 RepID=A0ABD2W8P5_9HYME